MKKIVIMLLAAGILLAGKSWAETLQVEHDHFWRGCKGRLIFGDKTVEYIADKKDHSRSWNYEDIQQLAIVPGRITILAYTTRRIDLGADHAFNFKLLAGKLSDSFRQEMEKKLTHPIVSGIVPDKTQARFAIPVRHRQFLKASQGILEFSDDYILYRSAEGRDSRIWHYDDLLSVGSTGPFQLRLGALQKTGGEYGEEKNYVFDLKRRLKPEEYDFVWGKIHLKQE